MAFSNKVIVITGASSGIGAEAAYQFAKLGGLVSLSGRNLEKLNQTGERCKSASGKDPLVIQSDVNNEEDVKKIVEQTIAKYNRIDVLVNNAGISGNGSIEDTNLAQFDSLMSTNVRSVYYLTMLAVPHLIQSKGNIVNVSSVCGLRPFPGIVSYNLTKSAIDHFTRCVALELGAKGVRVNSVNPGVVATNLHKRGGMEDSVYVDFMENCKSTHALRRIGTVEEVADAIAFLASDRASFITGVNLPVDGGCHVMNPR